MRYNEFDIVNIINKFFVTIVGARRLAFKKTKNDIKLLINPNPTKQLPTHI